MTGPRPSGPEPAPREGPSVAELLDFEAEIAAAGVTSPGRRAEAIKTRFGMRHVVYEQALYRVLHGPLLVEAVRHDPQTTRRLIDRRDAATANRADLTRAPR